MLAVGKELAKLRDARAAAKRETTILRSEHEKTVTLMNDPTECSGGYEGGAGQFTVLPFFS